MVSPNGIRWISPLAAENATGNAGCEGCIPFVGMEAKPVYPASVGEYPWH
jgi:hypothetical protein